jgi:hypothetical protein
MLASADPHSPRLVAGKSLLTGWRHRAARTKTPGLPSIRGAPLGMPTPSTLYAEASWTPHYENRPIERTVPTRTPGGLAATLSDWLYLRQARRLPPSLKWLVCVVVPDPLRGSTRQDSARQKSHAGSGGRLPGVAPCRRTDIQMPVLLLGPGGQLALVHVTPQRDQQLSR